MFKNRVKDVALRNRRDQFMGEIKIVADLHVHTVSSGHAYSTVMEIVKVAAQKGLKAVAITDHGRQCRRTAPLSFW